MKGVNNKKELSAIPKRIYVGYIWMSDEEGPKVLKDPTEFDFSKIGINPFVQEALLYCEDEEVSVMVRHTGQYHISEFELGNFPDEYELVEKEYYPHRLGFKDKKLSFKQLWIPEPDPNCDEMEVLTLKAHIFTGFKEPKN